MLQGHVSSRRILEKEAGTPGGFFPQQSCLIREYQNCFWGKQEDSKINSAKTIERMVLCKRHSIFGIKESDRTTQGGCSVAASRE